MNNKYLDNIEAFLKAFDEAENKSDAKSLLHELKQHNTEDEALIGLKLFLENHDWDYGAFKKAIQSTSENLNTISQKKNSKKVYFNSFLKYAALLVLTIGIISISFFLNKTTIDDYYPEEPGLPNYMSSDNLSKWTKSMKHFRTSEFQKMKDELNSINVENTNDTLVYFKAISNYKLENYDKANNGFLEVKELQNSTFQYEAEFRLGFTLYKANRIEESKSLFLKISKEKQHPYQKEALDIIESFFTRKNRRIKNNIPIKI